MFCAIICNDRWWPPWNAKSLKINTASCNNHSGIKLDQFQSMVLEILSFHVLAIFSNGGHLGASIPSKNQVEKGHNSQNKGNFAQNWT